ncbi:unnamed protein product [Sphagnum tenellum]
MGERKVLNKYYPPDFDPAKIPRRKQPKNQQIKPRMMLPMSIRCTTCGNYIYKGTKFNSRKEDCEGETYLGIHIFWFYFKCSRCSAELIMKTDPQNSDYIMESGASRNFEPWRATDEAMDEAVKQKNTEEMGDAMKALENRTIESKQEMDILAALDEMKSMRARHAMVGVDDMMQALRCTAEVKEKELTEADEVVLRAVVFQNSQNFVRRLDDDVLEDEYEVDIDSNEDSKGKGSGLKSTDVGVRSTAQMVDTLVSHVPELRAKGLSETGLGSQGVTKPRVPVFAVKAKKVQSSEKVVQLTQVVQEMAQAKNPMGLLLYYSSDDDDEESAGEPTRSSNISKRRKIEGPTGAAAAASREVMPQATNSIEDNVCGPEGNNESS